MSTDDSGRPPKPARRPVLRKIPSAAQLLTPPLPSKSEPSAPGVGGRPVGRADRQKEITPSPSRARMFDAPPKAVFPSSAPPPPPAAPSLRPAPSFDSPATGTPASSRTRASLPPVVASVVGPRPLAPIHVPRDRSARKAVIIGAAFGLVVVTVFVLAVRLAYHPQPSGTAAEPPTNTTVTKGIPTGSSPPAYPWVPSQGVSGGPSASGQAAPKGNLQGGGRMPGISGLSGPPKAPARPAEPPSDGVTTGGPGAVVASPKAAATPAGADHAAPDDSAPSMVPVIPPGPPPEVDPLVKAVLEANDPHRN